MKNKKIACIFNMNSNMFTITRFLRDRGYDAHLLLIDEDDHFLPKADSFLEDYKTFTHQLTWWPKTPLPDGRWTDIKPNQIKKDLKEYDVLIGCGFAPAFIEYGGRKLDLFIPYGSDFYELPFKKMWLAKKNSINNLYPKLQKQGIENSRFVVFDYTKEQEPVFKKFDLKGQRKFVFPPVFYTRDFNKDVISSFYNQSVLYPLLKKIRDENELLIFQHSRQSWKNPADEFSNKRNDILIHSFAKFISQKPNITSKLILLEYGSDVDDSKKLIKDLKIDDYVYWLPKSYRKELFVAISLCDIGVAELGMSFLMYVTVGEFMAMQLPFIHNCNMDDYKGKYPELYSVNHADSEESLLMHFLKYIENKEEYKNRAKQSEEWFMKYIINEPLDKIIDMIEESYDNRSWFKKLLE
jgi:hypothetical protein